MAIKRFSPVQDAFIAKSLVQGTGRDEILEIGYCDRQNVESSARILMDFPVDDILCTVKRIRDFKAILHLTTAVRRNIPAEYSLTVHRVLETWNEGIGRVTDSVRWENGVSWEDRGTGEKWTDEGGTFDSNPITTLTFTAATLDRIVDVDIDVTDLIRERKLKSILIKAENEDEFFQNMTKVSFFSSNTHTIYAPYIEIEYDDSLVVGNLPELADNFYCTATNLRETYRKSDIEQIRLGIRPQYPPRVFSTSSIYLEKYVLPRGAQWGIKDNYTADMLVNFSEGTRISADESGNYFTLNMSQFTTERYLDLMVQVKNKGSKHTYKVGTFKVTRL